MDSRVFEGDFGSKCVTIAVWEHLNFVVCIVHRYEGSIGQIVARRLTSELILSSALTRWIDPVLKFGGQHEPIRSLGLAKKGGKEI